MINAFGAGGGASSIPMVLFIGVAYALGTLHKVPWFWFAAVGALCPLIIDAHFFTLLRQSVWRTLLAYAPRFAGGAVYGAVLLLLARLIL